MKRTWNLFGLILGFACAGQAHAKTAYIGIAGPGGGMGVMGHAFLVVANRPKIFLGAQAYQFNINLPVSIVETFKQTGRIDLSRIPFILSQMDALQFIRIYTAENRPVTLFPLRLNDPEITRLETLLRNELRRRSRSVVADYDLLSNNCATQAVSFVNRALLRDQNSRSLPMNWNSRDKKYFSTSAWVTNTPLTLAPILQSSPQVDHTGIVDFNPERKDRALVSMTIVDRLQKIKKACDWSEAQYRFYSPLLVNPRTRVSIRLLDAFTRDVRQCKNSQVDVAALANMILDVIIFDFQQFDQMEIEEMVRVSQRLESFYL